ncbi:MAG: hypothetical protein Q9162_007896 [Coniocarpon cinnabarinum]
MLYPVGILCLKLSIALLYIRLFDRVMSRSIRIAIYFIGVFCVLFYAADLALEIASGAQCGNILASITSAFCIQSTIWQPIVSGVINSATDIYLLLLPIPSIIKIQMPLRRKLGVLVVLGAGAIVKHLRDPDALHTAAIVSVMTSPEMHVGCVAACMVIMPKLAQSSVVKSATYKSLLARMTGRTGQDRESTEKDDQHCP